MNLTIPTPCDEDWDAMTPTTCGRFCAVCQKEVIDISHMDDTAILQIYLENGGKLCVQARTEQISPAITVRTYPMQRLAVFALAVWLAFAGGLVNEVQAQMDTHFSAYSNEPAILKVTVIDKDQKPVFDAKITLLKDNDFIHSGLTDEAGTAFMENIDEGIYVIKIKVGDETTRQKIQLSAKQMKEIVVRLHTRITPPALTKESRAGMRGDVKLSSDCLIGNSGKITKRYEFDLTGKSYWVDR